MWAGFTPQIGDIVTVGLTTGTFLIVIVILGSFGIITSRHKAARNEDRQKGSQ